MILEPAKYIDAGDMSASITGKILRTRGLNNLTFTGSNPATGTPIGAIELWCSNDPRAELDDRRGLAVNSYTAEWHRVSIPAEGLNLTGGATRNGNGGIALDGNAATYAINVVDLWGYMQLRYVRSSGTGTLNMRREGN